MRAGYLQIRERSAHLSSLMLESALLASRESSFSAPYRPFWVKTERTRCDPGCCEQKEQNSSKTCQKTKAWCLIWSFAARPESLLECVRLHTPPQPSPSGEEARSLKSLLIGPLSANWALNLSEDGLDGG